MVEKFEKKTKTEKSNIKNIKIKKNKVLISPYFLLKSIIKIR